ncbi:MAG TPA: hypothetical protein VEV19_08440 [Ktedonobacteraceae bacterium]|jgi:hypothetical protein|nr:hypothetical protein [Ktedonobacteraceae bacterium]
MTTLHSSERPISHFNIRSAGENAKFVEYTPPFAAYEGTYKAPEGNYYQPDIYLEFCDTAEEYERRKAYDKVMYVIHERFWSNNMRVVERTRRMLFECCQMALEGSERFTVTHYDVRGLKRYSFGLIAISPSDSNDRTFIGYTRLYKTGSLLHRSQEMNFDERIPRIPDALLGCEMSSKSLDESPYSGSIFLPDIDADRLDVGYVRDQKIDLATLRGGDAFLRCVSGIIILKRRSQADAFNW